MGFIALSEVDEAAAALAGGVLAAVELAGGWDCEEAALLVVDRLVPLVVGAEVLEGGGVRLVEELFWVLVELLEVLRVEPTSLRNMSFTTGTCRSPARGQQQQQERQAFGQPRSWGAGGEGEMRKASGGGASAGRKALLLRGGDGNRRATRGGCCWPELRAERCCWGEEEGFSLTERAGAQARQAGRVVGSCGGKVRCAATASLLLRRAQSTGLASADSPQPSYALCTTAAIGRPFCVCGGIELVCLSLYRPPFPSTARQHPHVYLVHPPSMPTTAHTSPGRS